VSRLFSANRQQSDPGFDFTDGQSTQKASLFVWLRPSKNQLAPGGVSLARDYVRIEKKTRKLVSRTGSSQGVRSSTLSPRKVRNPLISPLPFFLRIGLKRTSPVSEWSTIKSSPGAGGACSEPFEGSRLGLSGRGWLSPGGVHAQSPLRSARLSFRSPMPGEMIVSAVAITLDHTVKIDRNEFLQTLRLSSLCHSKSTSSSGRCATQKYPCPALPFAGSHHRRV
jgi:hypothetical protein